MQPPGLERRDTILDQLQNEIENLPSALARIAKYVLENPEKVLRQSVAELGEFSGSGEASIVRLCRQIGFSGFRDFKLTLAAELGHQPPLPSSEAGADAQLQALHDSIAKTLAAAHARSAPGTLADIGARLSSARRIDLYGAGLSGIIAELLAYRLLRAGLTAQAFRDANMAHEVANGLSPDCVAIAFSISGLSRDTIQFLKAASAAGATTVAITNRPNSPLGDVAQFTLQAASLNDRAIGGTLGSATAKIFVIEALMLSLARSRVALETDLE